VVTRQQAQTAALVTLLQALPEQQLVAVLDGLGIAQERRPEHYKDDRRCLTCGFGWVRHKALADHPDDGHDWRPNRPVPRQRDEEETEGNEHTGV